MTFKIHQVYKQSLVSKVAEVEDVEDVEAAEEQKEPVDPQNLSLSTGDSKVGNKSLQQLRNDVLNSRSSVKPGTKNGVRPTAFDGGLEADMY